MAANIRREERKIFSIRRYLIPVLVVSIALLAAASNTAAEASGSAKASGADPDTCGTAAYTNGTIPGFASWCFNNDNTYFRITNLTDEDEHYVLSIRDTADGARFQTPTGPEFSPGYGISSDDLDQDVWQLFSETGSTAATVASGQTLVVTSSQPLNNLKVKHDISASIANAAASEAASAIYPYLFPESAKAEAIAGCVNAVRTTFDAATPGPSTPAELVNEFWSIYNGIDQCKDAYKYLVEDSKTGKDNPADDKSIFDKLGDGAEDCANHFSEDLLKMATESPGDH